MAAVTVAAMAAVTAVMVAVMAPVTSLWIKS
jgi:hypothetical protein